MASPLQYKVYDSDGNMVGAARHSTAAAALVSLYGLGSSIKRDGKILWREGKEDQFAGESFDHVSATVLERLNEHNRKALARLGVEVRAEMASA